MVVLSTGVETASGGVGRCSVWEVLELPVPRSDQRETSFQVYTTSYLFCPSYYPENSQEQEVIFQGLLWRQGVRKRLEQRFEAAIALLIPSVPADRSLSVCLEIGSHPEANSLSCEG